MIQDTPDKPKAPSRREFLATTSDVLLGAAATGLMGQAEAAQRHAQRGVLRFATRADALGLDPHRNVIYLVSQPLAATIQGLLDLTSPLPGD